MTGECGATSRMLTNVPVTPQPILSGQTFFRNSKIPNKKLTTHHILTVITSVWGK